MKKLFFNGVQLIERDAQKLGNKILIQERVVTIFGLTFRRRVSAKVVKEQ